jgi:hypothetical protein
MRTQVAHVRSRVSEILHQHIIGNPPAGSPTVKQIEQHTDTPASTVYKVLLGDKRFVMTIEEFPDFYEKYGRPFELLRWLVRSCEATKRMNDIAGEKDLNGEVRDENDRIVIKAADAIKGRIEALQDGRWSDQEIAAQENTYLEIISEATSALRELETIKTENNRGRTRFQTAAVDS